MITVSCKSTYSFEGQQRGGDRYQVEWITTRGEVATCLVIDSHSGGVTTHPDALETTSHKFVVKDGMLHIYDYASILRESVPIRDYIFYCSAKGYTKILRTEEISDLISGDYREMKFELIDHLVLKKLIP